MQDCLMYEPSAVAREPYLQNANITPSCYSPSTEHHTIFHRGRQLCAPKIKKKPRAYARGPKKTKTQSLILHHLHRGTTTQARIRAARIAGAEDDLRKPRVEVRIGDARRRGEHRIVETGNRIVTRFIVINNF